MENTLRGQHFLEKGFTSRASWLSDAEYAQVLDNFVIAAVDIVVINEKQEMLLGKRTRFPQKDWWVMGGRMKPGESFEETASRVVDQELGIAVGAERFRYLCTYSVVWAKRDQHPRENGVHTIVATMLLLLTRSEVSKIKLIPQEYEEFRWKKYKRIASDTNFSSFHPILVGIAQEIERRRDE